jgi:hypothetical protein
MGIASRGLGEAIDVIQIDFGLARLEPLIGPERDVHGAGRLARRQTPVLADGLERL